MKKRLLRLAAVKFIVTLATTAAFAQTSWQKIGPAFGRSNSYQFGFDTSATAGNCADYAFKAHIIGDGPCRTLILLSRNGQELLHSGFGAFYSAPDTPNYTIRLGASVGRVALATAQAVSEYVPYLESIGDWKPPTAISYLGNITSVDYSTGRIKGHWDNLLGVKVNIPLTLLDNAAKTLFPTLK